MLHFLGGGDLQGAHDAEPDPLGIRMKPDALGQLRILHFPGTIRAAAGGAAAHRRFVIPRTAAHGQGIRLSLFVPGIDSASGNFFVIIWIILIEHPFHYIAVNIVKPPGVGLLFADLLILEITILFVPRVFSKLARVLAPEVSRSGAGPAGVFLFSFSW